MKRYITTHHSLPHNRVNGCFPEIYNGSIHCVDTVALWSADTSCHLLLHCKTLPCVGWTNQAWACKNAENSLAALSDT